MTTPRPLYVWGEPGRSALPEGPSQPAEELRTALAELAANARSGDPAHPCDVQFGRAITHVLAEAERQIAAAQRRPATR